MDGAEVLVETFESAGITHAFGVVGTTVLNVIDEMDRTGMRYVSTRHEHTAAAMATGYTLATREPSVSISHVGPGAANQVIGIAAAHRDDVPVICVTGNEPSDLLGNDVNHEWDVMGVFSRITKNGVRATEAQFGKQVQNMVVRSVTGMPGPVHIDVPIDVADADVNDPDERGLRLLADRDMRASVTRARPPESAADCVREILVGAERPLIVAGTEVRWTDAASELRRLAELIDVPVVSTESARGVFPESHELSLGPVTHKSIDAGNEYFSNADVVIGVGTRFSDITTDKWTLIDHDATVVQATLRADELDRHVVADLSVLSDAASFCQVVADAVEDASLSFAAVAGPARDAFERARRDLLTPDDMATDGVDPRLVVGAVERFADDFAYTTGGGVHNTFPRLLPVDDPAGYFGTRNFSGMSQGFPLALGAQVALDRQVIAFEGDGGFSMVMQDLETAVREDIPVKLILFNNDAYMSHAVRQERNYGGRYVGTYHSNPSFDVIAEEFGMFGKQVTENDEVDEAVQALLDEGGPGLLDVHVDPRIGI